MLPTRRLLGFAALGLIPALLAPVMPQAYLLALLWLVLVGAAAAGNILLGARAEQIQVLRTVKERFSLGEWETVELTVRNYSRFPIAFEVTDTPPAGWEKEKLPGRGRCNPGQEVVLQYRVRPASRGRFRFGPLALRLEHFPGLMARQIRIDDIDEVRVYPDLRDVARFQVMTRRSRLAEFGVHRSRMAGRGTEFERIRDYSPDDEYRQIDWKASARKHRPMSRVYEVERSQNVFLVIDAGRMMAGRVGKLAKLDYAVNAALMLAHVALEAGDRVGLMIVSDGIDAYLPLGKGQSHFNQCLELLYGVEARFCHVDYRAALEEIAIRCKRRSLVVFFTDLVDEDTSAELVTYMRLLRPTHLPLCVTLQDNEVLTAARRVVTDAPSMYERAVALDLMTERRRVLDSLHRLGSLILDSPPDQLSVGVVNRYLELKSRQLL